MTDLARELGKLKTPEGDTPWVRLHYVYPYPHVDQVIPLMAEGLVLPYLDIPFQHASPKVLKAMRRPANEAKVLERLKNWRAICPDIAIRSSFVVGFPGETEEDFQYLLNWLEEAQLDRVGAFRFEPVEGAAANDLPDPVPGRGQGRALPAHHGANRPHLRRKARRQGRQDHRRADRPRRRRRSPATEAARIAAISTPPIPSITTTSAPPAAPRPTRRKSTAKSTCATPAG